MMSLTELEPAVWSEKQFGTCELGDERRTRRLVRYAQQMAEKPDASTPKQTESWSDCKAVYRLFGRPEVNFASVTAVLIRTLGSFLRGDIWSSVTPLKSTMDTRVREPDWGS